MQSTGQFRRSARQSEAIRQKSFECELCSGLNPISPPGRIRTPMDEPGKLSVVPHEGTCGSASNSVKVEKNSPKRRNGLRRWLKSRTLPCVQRDDFSLCTSKFESDMASHAVGSHRLNFPTVENLPPVRRLAAWFQSLARKTLDRRCRSTRFRPQVSATDLLIFVFGSSGNRVGARQRPGHRPTRAEIAPTRINETVVPCCAAGTMVGFRLVPSRPRDSLA
jgi:hypothetical protein